MSIKPKCYANYHMSPEEYGLWTHLREISSRSDYVYYLDDRSIARRFQASKNSINRVRRSLAEKGWFGKDFARGFQRAEDGRFQSQKATILSHDEWAQENSGRTTACHEFKTGPVPESKSGNQDVIGNINTDTYLPNSNRTFQTGHNPIPNGTYMPPVPLSGLENNRMGILSSEPPNAAVRSIAGVFKTIYGAEQDLTKIGGQYNSLNESDMRQWAIKTSKDDYWKRCFGEYDGKYATERFLSRFSTGKLQADLKRKEKRKSIDTKRHVARKPSPLKAASVVGDGTFKYGGEIL